MSVAVAFGVALALTPLLGRLGRRVGLVDHPSDPGLKIHTEAIPLTGGIGVVIGVVAAAAATGSGVRGWSAAAVLLVLAVGIADDLVALPQLPRLVAQLAAGGLLAMGGATFGPLGDLGSVVMILAVPVLANAVNLTDGQDGLAGGLAAVAALGLAAIAYTGGGAPDLGLAMVGALLGFLVWNRHPASVFLGDGGAYATGCLLAILAGESSRSWEGLAGSALCLLVFGVELVSTVMRRLTGRSAVLSGDRAHVYDHLAERWGSRHRVTIVLWSVGSLAAALGWLAARASLPVSVALVVGTALASSAALWALWRKTDARPRPSGSRTDRGSPTGAD